MKRIILLLLLVSTLAFGRDILIGDRIDLEIRGAAGGDIRAAFNEFEIEEIRDTENGVVVGIRGYTPGKKTVVVGDKILTIDIKSSLEEGEDQIKGTLSDGSSDKMSEGSFPWVFLTGASAAIISGTSLIYSCIKNKKRAVEEKNPKKRFYKGLERVGEDYPYEISYLLREYGDVLLGGNLLSGRYEVEGKGRLSEFLKRLDHAKFQKKTSENRDELIGKARELALDMEKIREELKGDV